MTSFFSWFRNNFLKRKNSEDNSITVPLIEKSRLKNLESVIGIKCRNKSIYAEALTHRSYLETNESCCTSNERLEFLGDSVLNLVIARYLFENYPEEGEGFLTKIRAKLVNKNSLGGAADKLNLGSFLIIGDNMKRDLVNNSVSVLADSLEALIGAIYIDQGITVCRHFIHRILIEPNMNDDDFMVDQNYKSQLLEYTQAEKIDTPVYEVIKEEGPQHDRVFTIRVSIGKEEMGIGKGKNKKTAEQNAARKSLRKMMASGKE